MTLSIGQQLQAREAQWRRVMKSRLNARLVPVLRATLPRRTGALRRSVRVVNVGRTGLDIVIGGQGAPYWRYVPQARALVGGDQGDGGQWQTFQVKAALAQAQRQAIAEYKRVVLDQLVQDIVSIFLNALSGAGRRKGNTVTITFQL